MPLKWGHFFTLTERMAVAILEEVNNHADVDFKHLKDICGRHTIYRNGTKLIWMKHMAQNWQKSTKKDYRPQKLTKKKSLPVGSHWVGSVRPPETQVFFFLFFWENKPWHFMWILCWADDSHEMSRLPWKMKKTLNVVCYKFCLAL